MDADDGDLARFVAHLVAAIGSIVPALGDTLSPLVQEARAASAPEIGLALADRLFAIPDAMEEVILLASLIAPVPESAATPGVGAPMP